MFPRSLATEWKKMFFCSGFVHNKPKKEIGEIVKEKENRLRYGLNISGVSDFDFWLSWFLTFFVITTFVSIYTIVLGYAFMFDIFLNTNFLFMFALFSSLTTAMILLGFVFSVIVPNLKTSNTLSYTFILFSFGPHESMRVKCWSVLVPSPPLPILLALYSVHGLVCDPTHRLRPPQIAGWPGLPEPICCRVSLKNIIPW